MGLLRQLEHTFHHKLRLGKKEATVQPMKAVDIQLHARKLFEADGPRAIAEAARKAAEHEARDDREGARLWRRIEAALVLMRGPRET